jgi:glycosyltransferase involved in cell wall biosynthesis
MPLTRALRDDIRRFAPTHFHLSAPDLLGKSAQRFARELRIPVVTSVHTRFETYCRYYGLQALAPTIERLLRQFYAGSDLLLAPTVPMAESLREGGGGERVRIWGRGVDRGLFTPDRRDPDWRRGHGYSDDDVVVLFFGRLVREKGLETFAEAIADLRRRGHTIRPLIVGDGPERAMLAARLGDAVFTGHLEGEALARAISSADILINPSVTEAFGNVNLEAMASGVAVVSAQVDSAEALIDPRRTGLLVEPTAPRAYADAVDSLIRSPAWRERLAMGAVAAAASYSWPAILDGVIDLYQSGLV